MEVSVYEVFAKVGIISYTISLIVTKIARQKKKDMAESIFGLITILLGFVIGFSSFKVFLHDTMLDPISTTFVASIIGLACSAISLMILKLLLLATKKTP